MQLLLECVVRRCRPILMSDDEALVEAFRSGLKLGRGRPRRGGDREPEPPPPPAAAPRGRVVPTTAKRSYYVIWRAPDRPDLLGVHYAAWASLVVLLPGRAAFICITGPKINDKLSVPGDRDAGADIETLFEIRDERLAHRLETGLTNSVDFYWF